MSSDGAEPTADLLHRRARSLLEFEPEDPVLGSRAWESGATLLVREANYRKAVAETPPGQAEVDEASSRAAALIQSAIRGEYAEPPGDPHKAE